MTDVPDNGWQRWGFFRRFKLDLIRLLRIKSTPDTIARGFALGVLIGFTPTFGLQIMLAVFFAFLLRQNKIAAFAGTWVTNPLTAPFVYALEYEVGRMLLGMPALGFINFRQDLSWEMGLQIGAPLLLGCLVLGIPSALISYALILRLIPSLRQYKIRRWPRRLRRLLPAGDKDRQS